MGIDRAVLRASWQSWVTSDLRAPAGPAWLQWAWTLLFCVTLAALFTVLGFVGFARGAGAWGHLPTWALWFGRNLVVCLCIGVLIHLIFAALRRSSALVRRVNAWPLTGRTVFFTGVSLLGLAVGWPLGMWIAGVDLLHAAVSARSQNLVIGSVMLSLLITFALHHVFAAKTRQIEAERRAAEAQLRLLQGQIEPHFLFNTLANVISLIDHDAPRARRMLETFTEYLRGSLGALRRDEVDLGTELDLAASYLNLLQMRMEDRLRFELHCPPELRALRLPPLLLQPLVENAVHHGLEPTLDGGRVSVQARRDGDHLVLEVHDDGRGLDAPAPPGRRRGAGLALANIRQRLLAQYGSEARLDLLPATPGTRARLTLPLNTAPAP